MSEGAKKQHKRQKRQKSITKNTLGETTKPMRKKERVTAILEKLDNEYGTDHVCYLEHRDAWQLLLATQLSAQCTDARVNLVTRELFKKYPDVKSVAQADLKEFEEMIKPTGFYHNKAKNIIACAREILERHDGRVPEDIEALTALSGVGRKTANVVRGNIYGIPSIVVDTHVKRISKHLGLTESDDPVKIEFELMKILPKDHWILYNIHIIRLGRSICKARKPACEECFLKEVCRYAQGWS